MTRRGMPLLALAAIAAALCIAAPAASAATAKLGGGSTTFALNAGVGAALGDAGVKVGVLKPATAGRKGIAFPISGGAIDPATGAGRIAHTGGLSFKAGGDARRAAQLRDQGRQALDAEREGRQGAADDLQPRPGEGEGHAHGARHDRHRRAGEAHRRRGEGAERRIRREAVREGPRGRHRDGAGDPGRGAARRRRHDARARPGRRGGAAEPRRRGVRGRARDRRRGAGSASRSRAAR